MSIVIEGPRGVLGMSVWVHTSWTVVVEVRDGKGSADGGPEGLSSSVGMKGHVVPLQKP